MKKLNCKNKIFNTKQNNGITLIALILTITIIVLMILAAVVAMKRGNSYTISESGEITSSQSGNQGGEEEVAINWKDNGDGTYTKGDETIEIGVTTFTNTEVLVKLGIKESEYEGTYGSKTGETWTVIGVEGDKIKLVSTMNVASSVKLGHEDPGAIVAVTLAEGEELTDAIKLQRSVWSYNHAIDTIKTAVETAIKGITGAKSITIEDIEEVLNITEEQKRTLNTSYGRTYRYYYEGDAETGKVYSQYLDRNETDTEAEDTTEGGWSNKIIVSDNIFTSYDKVIDGTDANKNNVVKLKNNYYDYSNAFTDTKFANSLGTGSYWLASPSVNCSANSAYFYVRDVSRGSIYNCCLFSSIGDAVNFYCGVRAVVYI